MFSIDNYFGYSLLMKILLLMLISSLCHSYDLEINLTDTSSDKGKIAIVIFNSETGFPKLAQHAYFKDFISIKDFPYRIGLPEGEYAISLFHDENENKELDTNFIGIPKEAFGFSNNVLGLMGPPSFKKAKFKVLKAKNKINIELKKF
jgi:uncharacterized protein (DUF2141 family)